MIGDELGVGAMKPKVREDEGARPEDNHEGREYSPAVGLERDQKERGVTDIFKET